MDRPKLGKTGEEKLLLKSISLEKRTVVFSAYFCKKQESADEINE